MSFRLGPDSLAPTFFGVRAPMVTSIRFKSYAVGAYSFRRRDKRRSVAVGD